MRKILLACLFVGFALIGFAQDNHLVKILVRGTHRYQPQDVIRATGLKENSVVTTAQLEAGSKRLGDSGVFTSVQYSFRPAPKRWGVEAEFQVKDADKFLPAEFENAVWWSDQELQSKLHDAVPLFEGEIPLSGTLADDVAAALSKLLAAKGVDSKVVWQQWAAPGEIPSVYRFRVTSGVPPFKSVQLTGASHLSAEVKSRFLSVVMNREYLRSEVEKNIDRILAPAYHEQGFVTFKAGKIQPVLAADNTLGINIPIVEGAQYKLAGYSWSGNTVASAEELSKFVSLPLGQPVNLSRLKTDLDAARTFLGKFGREAATITPVPKFSGESISYEFQVHEGDLYHMGDLEVQGLESATAAKIRELWKLAPGSPYDNTYARNFVAHLITSRSDLNTSIICEFQEETDDARKVVNVELQFKTE